RKFDGSYHVYSFYLSLSDGLALLLGLLGHGDCAMFDLNAEQRKLQSRAAELAASLAPFAAETDRSEEYPLRSVASLREAGFMGMTIPAAYGGKGASYLDAVLVVEQMARVCGATARITVEANMGAIGAIMRYGSEAQKRLAAELVLGGDKPAICITE